MSELRPFALLRSGDQWVRSSFDAVYLDLAAGVAELAWTTATAESDIPAPTLGAGLAFDQHCRIYHSLPQAGRVERLLWAALDPAQAIDIQVAPSDVFAAVDAQGYGDFTAPESDTPLDEPRGLAVDINDRLFIAEAAQDTILVYDLWDRRILRRIGLPAASRPTDLAALGTKVYAVLSGAGQIVQFDAYSAPSVLALPAGCAKPSRIAVSPQGHIAILAEAGTEAARVWFIQQGYADFASPGATDLEWESEAVLVVARQPGADFERYQIELGKRVERPPLRARAYDGLGIVALPGDGETCCACRRIGYWTALGFRTAIPARLVYERVGRVTSFRLDSGAYQTTWGRLFIDACIPEGAEVRLHCIVLDEADDALLLKRVPPANIQAVTILRPDLSPPMPPAALVPADGFTQALHRRESGRELPWIPLSADDTFATYEAPVNAPAGRYLWVSLELRGNTRVSPKIRCIRAEYPAHDYLRRLPKTFSRDPQAASFLQRYLAMFEGFLGEIEARSVDRNLLLDVRSTPDELLPWLASFIGLVLDERWADAPGGQDARRKIIAEMAWLFRYRGTLPGLKRFIELYVGTPVSIIEHFRLRGPGVAVLGDTGPAFSSSVLGYGFRAGGKVPVAGGKVEDAFRTHAHRFSVIIPAALTAEQKGVVKHIIDLHRPCHTVFDICVVGAGMRVGRGLLLEVTSLIGSTGGFSSLQLGGSALGRGSVIGRPHAGAALGAGVLGRNTQVG